MAGNRRRRAIFGIVAILLLVGLVITGAYVLIPFPTSPINRKKTDRIQTHMSRAEVEAILGCPPGDYRTSKVEYNFMFIVTQELAPVDVAPGATFETWYGDEVQLSILFDRKDRVARTRQLIEPRSPWQQRLRQWLFIPD